MQSRISTSSIVFSPPINFTTNLKILNNELFELSSSAMKDSEDLGSRLNLPGSRISLSALSGETLNTKGSWTSWNSGSYIGPITPLSPSPICSPTILSLSSFSLISEQKNESEFQNPLNNQGICTESRNNKV